MEVGSYVSGKSLCLGETGIIMGIISDFFVADETDAFKYEDLATSGDTLKLHEQFNPVQYNGYTDLELSTLWAILENQEWDLETHSLKKYSFGEDGETWLMSFPNSFRNMLCDLNEEKFELVTSEWVSTEELNYHENDVSIRLVRDLIYLSKLSKKTNNPLFLWGSL